MRFLAPGLATWCLGILAPLELPESSLAWLLLGSLVLACSFRLISSWGRYALAACLLLLGSMLWTHHLQPRPERDDVSRLAPLRWIKVVGRVMSDPIPTVNGARYELAVERLVAPYQRPAGGRLLVRFTGMASASYGETVILEGALNLPAIAMNPGEFSYRAYLARKGIFATISAHRTQRLVPASWSLMGMAIRLKAACVVQISRHMASSEASLLGSLLLGSGVSPVDPDVAEQFRDLGLAHVLAVSGAQILILLQALKGGLNWLRIRRRFGLPLAGAVVLIYGLMTGLPPSILRAMVMACATLLAWGLRRRAKRLLPLLIACWLMLLVQPLWLFDLGFLFSAIATFALQYASPLLTQLFDRLPAWLAPALGTSLAAMLWVTPLQLASFGQLSFWSLPANLFSIVFVEILTVGGAVLVPAGALLDWLPGGRELVLFAYFLTGCLLRLFHSGVGWLHQLPGASIHLIPLGPLACAGLYGLLALGFEGLRRNVPWLPGAAMGSAAILMFVAMKPTSSGLRIVMLSVGQGDAILIQTPRNRWFLVDAGPAWDGGDAASRTIVPYLQRQGVQRLAGLVLTHPHADHLGGALSLVSAMPVESVWDGGQALRDPRYHEVFKALLGRHIPWSTVHEGDRAELEPYLFLEVLGPPQVPYHGTHSDLNCNSVVFRLKYRQFKMLFAGDLERVAEARLASTHPESLEADVLKVSHHGSRFGSTPAFLSAIRPRASLISVGEHNVFHHPAPEAIARLSRFGPVFRTDRDGALTIQSDGTSWTLSGALGGPDRPPLLQAACSP